MPLNKQSKDLIYLVYCSLNNIKPNLDSIDLNTIYDIAKRQSLLALISYSILKSKDIDRFNIALNKSIKKTILFDKEREKLLSYLDSNDIWYLPLKGIILKDYYPLYGLREFADNDILFDKSKEKIVKSYFISQNYKVRSYHNSHHDVYIKDPIYNFEMHLSLFGDAHDKVFKTYYQNIKDKLIKDDNNKCGYHMSDDDYYIYFMAHLIKHYRSGGIGLRFYVDTYILINRFSNQNRTYIESEFDKLLIKEEALQIESISKKIFSSIDFENTLSQEEIELLNRVTFSGTYGDLYLYTKHQMERLNDGKMDKKTRRKYLFYRLFPSREIIKSSHPFIYKTIIFIPFFYISRIVKALIYRRSIIKQELKISKDLSRCEK